jgi:hypothetical protein
VSTLDFVILFSDVLTVAEAERISKEYRWEADRAFESAEQFVRPYLSDIVAVESAGPIDLQ